METGLSASRYGAAAVRESEAQRRLWEFLCRHPGARFNLRALAGVTGFEDSARLRAGLDNLVNAGVVRTFLGGKLYGLAAGMAEK